MNNDVLKRVNILYVEDEDEVRSLTTNILKSLVGNLVEACNGQEGLDIFKKHQSSEDESIKPFDLIITDINMPKMDGLTMLKHIHEIEDDLPSIITTAHNDADFLRESINQKVRGYVNKPLNLRDLIDNIVIAIEPKFLKDELISLNKNLESQIKEKTIELRSIIDSQQNLIAVIDGNKLTNINKTFLDFVGVNTKEEFEQKVSCICKLFTKGFSCEGEINHDNWIEKLAQLNDIKRVVHMINNNAQERTFQVSIKPFTYNTTHYVLSFTDITELKDYTNKLKFQATHDNLTKLFNRQKLNDVLVQEIARYDRYKREFSMIMFDIDDFKVINDTYGHDVGDEVLIGIAKIVTEHTRNTDVVARWGGEEFMILSPETNLHNCEAVAQNIRKQIKSYSFKGVDRPVTISIGITEYRDHLDKDKILKEADIALYKAKENGKDQVVKYEE